MLFVPTTCKGIVMKDSVVIKKGEHVIIRKYTKLQFLNDSKVEKRFSNI